MAPLLRSVARPERVQLSRRTLPANTRWNPAPWLEKRHLRCGAAGSQGRQERR